MEYGCDNTHVLAIGNGFVEVSSNESMANLVEFDDYLSKTPIEIGSPTTSIYLPSGNIIYHLNDNSIIYQGYNSLVSTSKAKKFGVDINDVAKIYFGSKYINTGYWFIPMDFDR